MTKTAEDRLHEYAAPGNLWSYSSLSKFQACAYSWYGRYILQLAEPPSRPLAQGILCHTVLEEVFTRGQAPDQWIEAVRQARTITPHADLIPEDMDETLATWLQTAWEQRSTAPLELQEVSWVLPIKTHPDHPAVDVDVAPVEQMLDSGVPFAWVKAKQMLAGSGVDGIYAKPDWVGIWDQRIQLKDWKTSQVREGYTPIFVASKYQSQIALYALFAQRRFPERAIESSIYLLPAATSVILDTGPRVQKTVAHVMATSIWMIKDASSKGPESFRKQVGNACRFCHLATLEGVCPEGAAYKASRGWS